jgi:hypothetical protein
MVTESTFVSGGAAPPKSSALVKENWGTPVRDTTAVVVVDNLAAGSTPLFEKPEVAARCPAKVVLPWAISRVCILERMRAPVTISLELNTI